MVRWGVLFAILCCATLCLAKDEDIATLKRKAKDGDPVSMYQLALAYENGVSVEKDLKESIRWLQKSTDLLYTPAMHKLGLQYAKGEGVLKDPSKSLDICREAAELGHAPSQSIIATLYAEGKSGYRKNYADAFRWASLSAAQGNSRAAYILATLYLDDRAPYTNHRQGIVWLKRAAWLGYAEAEWELGLSYRYGRDVKEDPVLALAWMQIAKIGSDETDFPAYPRIEATYEATDIERSKQQAAKLRVKIRKILTLYEKGIESDGADIDPDPTLNQLSLDMSWENVLAKFPEAKFFPPDNDRAPSRSRPGRSLYCRISDIQTLVATFSQGRATGFAIVYDWPELAYDGKLQQMVTAANGLPQEKIPNSKESLDLTWIEKGADYHYVASEGSEYSMVYGKTSSREDTAACRKEFAQLHAKLPPRVKVAGERLVPEVFWQIQPGMSWREALKIAPSAQLYESQNGRFPALNADAPQANFAVRFSPNEMLIVKFLDGKVQETILQLYNTDKLYVHALERELANRIETEPEPIVEDNPKAYSQRWVEEDTAYRYVRPYDEDNVTIMAKPRKKS